MPRKSNTHSNGSGANYRVEYLTEKQERILAFIRRTIAEQGGAPTVIEIGAEVGLRSRSSVIYQLREFEVKNAIRRRARGIRLA
ncbi:LexA family protein [Streptomyces sp. HUAS TT11]|uniref:LexA family protein n=1 Tax=Streptomyces sp. HUAS TT11 TaxID=3447508 RepID=UPI003F65E5D3